MAELPAAAVQRAAEVMWRQYDSQYSAGHLSWRDFADDARAILAAALDEPATPDPDRPVVDALVTAATDGRDFGGWLAGVLASAAARLGSSAALTAARPGSWEAHLVDELVKKTVGYGDEYLDQYREAQR